MKASLLVLTMFTFTFSASGTEMMFVTDGYVPAMTAAATPAVPGEFVADNEKDMKIATLNKLIDQQQRLYEEKINYLEFELKKSKDRLVEKSINHDKMQSALEKHFAEESSFLKKELVTKTKTLMEYQRQLEKIKPSEDMKNLIKINTDMAVELRKSADQLAFIQLEKKNEATKNSPARMPASVSK